MHLGLFKIKGANCPLSEISKSAIRTVPYQVEIASVVLIVAQKKIVTI